MCSVVVYVYKLSLFCLYCSLGAEGNFNTWALSTCRMSVLRELYFIGISHFRSSMLKFGWANHLSWWLPYLKISIRPSQLLFQCHVLQFPEHLQIWSGVVHSAHETSRQRMTMTDLILTLTLHSYLLAETINFLAKASINLCLKYFTTLLLLLLRKWVLKTLLITHSEK